VKRVYQVFGVTILIDFHRVNRVDVENSVKKWPALRKKWVATAAQQGGHNQNPAFSFAFHAFRKFI